MTFDEHANNLGNLVTNLQGLELWLRLFLCHNKDEEVFVPARQNSLPENHLTNYDSLGELIKKYNKIVSEDCPQFKIDDSVVELRDALAHGRLVPAATQLQPPQRIFKFNRPKNGFVEVVYDEVMDEGWFKKWITLTEKQMLAVEEADCKLNSPGFGGC